MAKTKDFAVFILTNRRADKQITLSTLRRCGYTGDVYLVVDDLDPTIEEYRDKFGEIVQVFDKVAAKELFDAGDNFGEMGTITHVRNAVFDIAEKVGVKYFIQLDDDYHHFQYRYNDRLGYESSAIKNLDSVFGAILEFYKKTNIRSIALAQGGDFIGGEDSDNAKGVKAKRKCMNSFICSTDRRFSFYGTMNEDVSTYTLRGSRGEIFLTTNQVSLDQAMTQSSSGGITELYLKSGTYVKSFYSVMFNPSSIKISQISDRRGARIHHSISWRHTVPKIIREQKTKAKLQSAKVKKRKKP